MSIDWLPWGRAAFEKSLKEAKPALLSISARWCHFCHIMDKETYGDDRVVKLVEEKFVPMRVDTDERPDINRRYNQGGWPSTVFLSNRGQVITGATFVPAEEMADLLEQVLKIYEKLEAGYSPSEIRPYVTSGPAGESPFEEKRIYFIKYKDIFLKRFEDVLRQHFDPQYGGFGFPTDGPKFPWVAALNYCLLKIRADASSIFGQILTKSLEGMSEHGLFDHLEGGFFRYSAQRNWERPHFEKMLKDNLELARIYFESGQVTGREHFSQVAEKTIDFLKKWLLDLDRGGFYASVDAEEDYYRLASRVERFNYRSERHRPRIDKTIYADLNGLAVEVLLEVGESEIAVRTFSRILKEFRSPNGLFYHFKREAQGYLSDFLADQVYLVKALVNPRWRLGGETVDLSPRTLAADVWSKVMEFLYDGEKGGFFDHPGSESDLGLLREGRKPLEENCEAIKILKVLGFEAEARRSLIEIFWQNKNPDLFSGPLSSLLLEF